MNLRLLHDLKGEFKMSKIDIMDMIISVLREHEKALDFKIDALDGAVADLKRETEKIEEILEVHDHESASTMIREDKNEG